MEVKCQVDMLHDGGGLPHNQNIRPSFSVTFGVASNYKSNSHALPTVIVIATRYSMHGSFLSTTLVWKENIKCSYSDHVPNNHRWLFHRTDQNGTEIRSKMWNGTGLNTNSQTAHAHERHGFWRQSTKHGM